MKGPMMRPLASGGPAEGQWTSEGGHRNHTEKSDVKTETFFFVDHLISTGKTARILVKTFFFFWRSHHNLHKSAGFSPSVLEFTKPEIRHI